MLFRSIYAVGDAPEGVVLGDFNSDGKIDAITTGANGSYDYLLLGNGDGTFAAASPIAVAGLAVQVATGDFNGDGKLDIVTTNYNTNTASVSLGDGSGGFTTSAISVGAYPLGVVVADLNGDGKLDFVTTNNVSNHISVLLGNGDGTFQAQLNYSTGLGPTHVATADFDQDGKLDLIVTNAGSISAFHGNGNGTFNAAVTYNAGATPGRITTGDFNGDGLVDVVFTDTAADTANVILNAAPGGAVSSATVTVNVLPPGPVILTDQVTVIENGNGTITVTGVHFADSDASAASDTFTLTVTTAAAPDSAISPASATGGLIAIDTALSNGVVYDPGTIGNQPLTDSVTVMVTDGFANFDTVNFIFNQAGTGPTVSLTGTSGKDVIFDSGYVDTLTGGAGADQFVFRPDTGDDTIIDFTLGQDHIDLRAFNPAVNTDNITQWLTTHAAQSPTNSADAVITLDANDSITLKNVTAANLTANDFILHIA